MIVVFFASWMALSQVNWVDIFEVRQKADALEEKLGELIWKSIESNNDVSDKDELYNPVDSILQKLCSANSVDRSEIKLHIVDSDEVNAFALPDAYMVVFTGLIEETENAEELAGVLAHEMAHIEMNHVMKKLIKEIGLSVLSSMTGGGGGEVIKEVGKVLSSSAFDRSLEKDADLKAYDYLLNSDIDPEPFANLLYRFADLTSDYMIVSWISTHPNPRERSAYIIESMQGLEMDFEPILADSSWIDLKKAVGDIDYLDVSQ